MPRGNSSAPTTAIEPVNHQPITVSPQLNRRATLLSASERFQRVSELSKKSVGELSKQFQVAGSTQERAILADALAMKGTGEAVLNS